MCYNTNERGKEPEFVSVEENFGFFHYGYIGGSEDLIHRKSYIESDLSKYDAGRKLSNAGKLYEYDMSAQTARIRKRFIRRTRARRNLRR